MLTPNEEHDQTQNNILEMHSCMAHSSYTKKFNVRAWIVDLVRIRRLITKWETRENQVLYLDLHFHGSLTSIVGLGMSCTCLYCLITRSGKWRHFILELAIMQPEYQQIFVRTKLDLYNSFEVLLIIKYQRKIGYANICSSMQEHRLKFNKVWTCIRDQKHKRS